jgi:hypothetical protein
MPNATLEMFNLGDDRIATHQVDALFQFPGAAGDAEIPQVDERRLLWKIQ